MRQQRRIRRLIGVVAGLALIAAACGDDDDDEVVDEPDEPDVEGFVVGHIFPETGELAFLGPPQQGGAQLAVEDINEAGGVLGEDVTLLPGDEAGDAAIVREETDRLIDAGIHALIGAAASGMSQEIIQTTFDNEIVQCSPSNTSPAFTDQGNAGFYFRATTSDVGQSPIIAAEVAAAGHQTAAVAARADDYGVALQGLVEESLEEEGIEVTDSLSYDPEATTFDAEIGQMTAGDPDAFVLISFDEGATIIAGLLEAGVTPDQLFGADGLFSGDLPELVDPAGGDIIDGMTVTAPAVESARPEFLDRLREISDDLTFGPHAYDCMVVLALAVEAAGTTDPSVFVDEMVGVTRDGTACDTFEECRDLLAEGEDIDYNGVTGPLNFRSVEGAIAGEPTVGDYDVGLFEDGEPTPVALETVDLEE